jgi:hypothetical protein
VGGVVSHWHDPSTIAAGFRLALSQRRAQRPRADAPLPHRAMMPGRPNSLELETAATSAKLAGADAETSRARPEGTRHADTSSPPSAGMAEKTLGQRLVDRDRARFVGRRRELQLFDQLFVEDPPANVVLLRGPAGIGKSTLLREVVRRGERCGWRPHWIEGRELLPVADVLEHTLTGAREEERPLIVFDSYERMSGLGGYLRRSVLPSLSEQAIVVVAVRGLPEAAWSAGGWETVVREVELGGLSCEESRELLRLAGMEDERLVRDVVLWSGGSPLALALAAEPGTRWVSASAGGGPADPGVVRALVRRLAGSEFEERQLAILSVAAIARVTTVDLLRHVLPETNADRAYEWLASRSFAEPLGDGITLHDLVGKALAADLRPARPQPSKGAAPEHCRPSPRPRRRRRPVALHRPCSPERELGHPLGLFVGGQRALSDRFCSAW